MLGIRKKKSLIRAHRFRARDLYMSWRWKVENIDYWKSVKAYFLLKVQNLRNMTLARDRRFKRERRPSSVSSIKGRTMRRLGKGRKQLSEEFCIFNLSSEYLIHEMK